MASEIQYQSFKAVYDEESVRHAMLESRSKLYLTIITFYLGVLAFRSSDALAFVSRFHIPIPLYILLALILIVALLFTIAATYVRSYEGVCDLEEVIRSWDDSPPTDEAFLDERLIDLAVATNRNARQNNRVGSLLRIAAILIFFAVLLQLLIFLLAIIKSRG